MDLLLGGVAVSLWRGCCPPGTQSTPVPDRLLPGPRGDKQVSIPLVSTAATLGTISSGTSQAQRVGPLNSHVTLS